jgi:hypothetical protein
MRVRWDSVHDWEVANHPWAVAISALAGVAAVKLS